MIIFNRSMQLVKFANIEEDTPFYHSSYDYFIQKFASMCQNDHEEVDLKKRLRIAGLLGIEVT